MQHDNMIQCPFYLDRQHKRVFCQMCCLTNHSDSARIVHSRTVYFLLWIEDIRPHCYISDNIRVLLKHRLINDKPRKLKHIILYSRITCVTISRILDRHMLGNPMHFLTHIAKTCKYSLLEHGGSFIAHTRMDNNMRTFANDSSSRKVLKTSFSLPISL